MVALLSGVTLSGTAGIGKANSPRVLVHNRGGLDWDRPTFENRDGGMFGLLPVYARANGIEFNVLDKDDVTDDDLREAQVFVLINSPKTWAGTEKAAVLNFVRRGGSLLVLGDHTDVFGLMRGFNTLLDEFGIAFRFDSAYPARLGWRGCLRASHDAVAWQWEREHPGVAIGASLELSGHARPLLTGIYGHSDHGLRENVVGSFLGNYEVIKRSGAYIGRSEEGGQDQSSGSTLGRPRGRSVEARPNTGAMRFVQASLPYGLPRCTLRRIARSSASVCG